MSDATLESKLAVGVFGLGSMGSGMAISALNAGIKVFGFDPQPTAMDAFIKAGGQTGDAKELCPMFDIAVLVVINATQTEDVLFGCNGIVQFMPEGAAVRSCATIPPDVARNLSDRCLEAGLHF